MLKRELELHQFLLNSCESRTVVLLAKGQKEPEVTYIDERNMQ